MYELLLVHGFQGSVYLLQKILLYYKAEVCEHVKKCAHALTYNVKESKKNHK